MKIVSSGKGLNSPEFYKNRNKRKRLKRIIFLIAFVLVLSTLVYIVRLERFRIAEVLIEGDNIAGRDYIVEVVGRELLGNYLLVIPRANILFYPRSFIKENLLVEFPRFKSVDLDLDSFRTLIINVEERLPFALYCAEASLSASADNCFVLDEEGFIFARANFVSKFGYFIYTARVPIDDPVGTELLPPEEFRSLEIFKESLTGLDISLSLLEISSDDYSLVMSTGGEIIWRKDADRALIYTNLEAFLSDEAIVAQENFLEKVLYLDLRTEDKVFYRFK
jgi:hypothetical protein